MSLAGFKKQLNKANQYMSEKIAGAKGTELDDEFVEMEKKIDVMGKLVEELMARTHELLQPNPASRAKLSAVKSISKLRGHQNHALYPQPEGQLGECMVKYGQELGDSMFGESLIQTGESYKQLAEIKYALEDNVKQNFIEPLHHLQSKDLKEVNHHRKKLQGRRLDYDCKKRKQMKGSNISENDIQLAEDKFEEMKDIAERAMYNVLDNDMEQISVMVSFIDSEIQYHQQAMDVLSSLSDRLRQKSAEAANRPRNEHVPKRAASTRAFDKTPSPNYDNNFDVADNSGYSLSPAPASYNSSSRGSAEAARAGGNSLISFGEESAPTKEGTGSTSSAKVGAANKGFVGGQQASCEAIYDFEPENEGELGFKEGDVITLLTRVDENWFEGQVHGITGYFPVNYVKVLVDL